MIECSSNDSIGDDEFTFIITDRGAVPLTQRYQMQLLRSLLVKVSKQKEKEENHQGL